MTEKAKKLGLPLPEKVPGKNSFVEDLPQGRLMHDCSTRRIETVSETVTLLATAFLNLAAESEQVHAASKISPEDYESYVKSSVSEENLRSLELRFHNLQSLYDTYVSGTEAEREDQDLPVLRGHISVVFHLLTTATLFAHYFERHVDTQSCNKPERRAPLVNSLSLLTVLMEYSLSNISQYISCAQRLCHQMLKRYIDVDQIEVNVPQYRGFHVRPSTLISKLVLHYGSDVKMEIDDETYDASSAMELFRANEKINAHKRRLLAKKIDNMLPTSETQYPNDLREFIISLLTVLAEHGEVILYEQPLELPEQLLGKGGSLREYINDEIGRLLALGKIDIILSVKARFKGDKRVLADIKLLAESGYGEDCHGNNIALPKALSYLRR